MDWKKIGIGVFVVDAVMLNLGLGYLLYKSPYFAKATQGEQINSNTYTYLEVDSKLAGLKQEILAEVIPAGQSGTPVPSLTPQPTIRQYAIPAVKTKTRSVSYVTVPGSGRSNSMNWLDLPGTEFYFDKGDYPGWVEAYFEANISLLNGNGRAYFRLFDVTHGIGLQGSEAETTSQISSIVTSGQLNFWSGKNLYRVQARTLTADTAIFSSGRLRIVTEN